MHSPIINRFDPYRLIVFDFDGTLARLPVDWPELKRQLQALYADTFNVNVPCQSLTQWRNEIIDRFGPEVLNQAFRLQESHEMRSAKDLRMERSKVALLRELAERKKLLAVHSANTRAAIELVLRQNHVMTLVSWIFSIDDPIPGKPRPDGLSAIMRMAGIPVNQTAYVGDQPSDEAIASACGAYFIPTSELP